MEEKTTAVETKDVEVAATHTEVDYEAKLKEKDAEIAYLRMRVDVICAVRVNAYKSDRANPEFTKFEMLLLSQMWHRFTRAKGEDREGVASKKVQFSYSGVQRTIKGESEKK